MSKHPFRITTAALGTSLIAAPSLAPRPAIANSAHSPHAACSTDWHLNPVADAAPDLATLAAPEGHWLKARCDTSPSIITYAFEERTGQHEQKYVDKNKEEKTVTLHTSPLNAMQRAQLMRAFAEYERVLNVKFVPFGSKQTNIKLLAMNRNQPILIFRNSDIGQIDAAGQGCFPDYRDPHFRHYIDFNPININGIEFPGNDSFRDILHEIGHCLGGLKHPEDPVTPHVLNPAKDSLALSVMSNRAHDGKSAWDKIIYRPLHDDNSIIDADGHEPSTLGVLDIAALQSDEVSGFGANWNYRLPNSTAKLTGERKYWTLWNGNAPTTLDASAYEGANPVTLNLNQGVPDPSTATNVGEEFVFIAYGPGVNAAIGAKKANNRFIGNEKAGGIFTGGNKANRYELFAKDNIVRTGHGKNTIVLNTGAEALVQGFTAGRDHIEVMGEKALVTAKRIGKDLEISFHNEKGPSGGVVLKDFRGRASDVSFLLAGSGQPLPLIVMAGEPGKSLLSQVAAHPLSR